MTSISELQNKKDLKGKWPSLREPVMTWGGVAIGFAREGANVVVTDLSERADFHISIRLFCVNTHY